MNLSTADHFQTIAEIALNHLHHSGPEQAITYAAALAAEAHDGAREDWDGLTPAEQQFWVDHNRVACAILDNSEIDGIPFARERAINLLTGNQVEGAA